MIARGPTLSPDRATWTGSLHIVDLPSAEAAYEFAEREPYNRAGMFGQHTMPKAGREGSPRRGPSASVATLTP